MKIYQEGKDFCYDFTLRCKYNYRIDFAFSEIKLGIECDGENWHLPNNEHDRKRDWVLKNKGWTMLRFTGNQIKNDIDYCIEKIRDEINGRKNS